MIRISYRSAERGLIAGLMFASVLVLGPGAEAATPIVTKGVKPLYIISDVVGGSLSLPTDVAIGKDGRVYVVDGGNNRLVIFDRRGKHIRTIGRAGSRQGEFRNPVGVGTDSQGHVYVADKDNQRVQVFSADGQFENAFAVESGGKPVSPVDVASSPDGSRLYISGNNNHGVMVYSQNGSRLGGWGKEGVNEGEFRFPATIAIANDKRVYVVDVFNTRVQVFNPGGQFVLEFSEWGVLPGQLVRPKGIAIDSRGRSYVSDSYMDVVQVFDDAHQLSHVLGSNGIPHRFPSAAGIAIDSDDRLYVAEVLKNRVSVYQLGP